MHSTFTKEPLHRAYVHDKIWLVRKKDNYQDCRDDAGHLTRRNFPEVIIEEVVYDSPLDLALKLNDITDLAKRLNKDYVYTDYDLAVKEANNLRGGNT